MAASVPRTEVVGNGEYFRFGMRDFLAIEASFLQREEESLSCWWSGYAECSQGPKEQPSSSKKVEEKAKPPLERAHSVALQEGQEERVGFPVKGGLYEVDLVKRHCFPVYWDGQNLRVLRGHWFARKGVDWLPLREDVSEQLEIAYRSQVWHRRTFQPSGLFAARVDLQGSIYGMHALFTGEANTWEAWLNADASGFSNVTAFSGNGIKLRMNYASKRRRRWMSIAFVSTETETDNPQTGLKPEIDLLGPVEDVFFDMYDRCEPVNEPTLDNCFISTSYDATTHFESTVMDVLKMYTLITGKILGLNVDLSAAEE